MMKRMLFLVGLAFCCSAQEENSKEVIPHLDELPVVSVRQQPVSGEAESLLPPGKKFKLVWHDEFNGTQLDTSKWSYRTNFWGRRAKWFAAPEDQAVEVRDGTIRLKLLKKGDQYLSPQLQTGELLWDTPLEENPRGFWSISKRDPKGQKFLHRYGYYECRCKLQQMPGWWSAFWMQTPDQGCTLDPGRSGIEHDIMESFDPGIVIPHCFHYNGYGKDYKGFRVAEKVRLDKTKFHTFGMLWEKDGYTFFIDGRQRGEKTGTKGNEAVSHVPEFLLISTEAKWYRNNRMTGKPVKALEQAVGDQFEVDFVRVFDLVE